MLEPSYDQGTPGRHRDFVSGSDCVAGLSVRRPEPQGHHLRRQGSHRHRLSARRLAGDARARGRGQRSGAAPAAKLQLRAETRSRREDLRRRDGQRGGEPRSCQDARGRRLAEPGGRGRRQGRCRDHGGARADQQDRRCLEPHSRSRSRQLLRDGHRAAAPARGDRSGARADDAWRPRYRAQKSLNDDEKAQILIRAGQFAAAVDGIARLARTPPTRPMATARPSRRSSAHAGRFAKAAADYLAAINAAAVVLRGDDRAKLDLANLKRLNDAVLDGRRPVLGDGRERAGAPAASCASTASRPSCGARSA